MHDMNEEDTPRQPGLSRRTVVKGAAWTIPAVAVAVAAPAASASQSANVPDMTVTLTASPETMPAANDPIDLELTLDVRNVGLADAAGGVTVFLTKSSRASNPVVSGDGWRLLSTSTSRIYLIHDAPILAGQSVPAYVTYTWNRAGGGRQNLTATIPAGSGGETNSDNNSSVVNIEMTF